MPRRFLWCAALLLCRVATAQELTPEQKRLNIESFERVWSTVQDTYFDAKLGGLDWKAVHDELRPLVEKAATMAQSRQIISGMLDRLHASHLRLIPVEAYNAVGAVSAGAEGSAGIDVRVVNGEALVTKVDAGSSAAKAGVRPGWRILELRGEPVANAIHTVDEAYRSSSSRDMFLARSVTAKLAGAEGEKLPMRFVDGAGQTRDLEIALGPPRGSPSTFGHLPTQHVWIESRRLDDNVGYIAFNMFLDPARLMPAFEEAVRSFQKTDGIVIDIRGNPGGIGIMAMGLAGWFLDKPNQRLGTMHTRQAPINFVVNPRLPVFRGPLAILVDGSSASTSEIFAGGMQDLKRARVFGARTAGAALPSFIDKLPNGDGFQCATADYISEGGKRLEGVGVVPDVDAAPTRELLLAGRDAPLEAALNWIHTK
jgi:carboxyl-terminal processing protease